MFRNKTVNAAKAFVTVVPDEGANANDRGHIIQELREMDDVIAIQNKVKGTDISYKVALDRDTVGKDHPLRKLKGATLQF